MGGSGRLARRIRRSGCCALARVRHRHADAARSRWPRPARGRAATRSISRPRRASCASCWKSIWISRASPNATISATTSSAFSSPPRRSRCAIWPRPQGYFSPVVRTDVRTVDGKKRVTVSVDPGPQTTISSVSLSFNGAGARPKIRRRKTPRASRFRCTKAIRSRSPAGTTQKTRRSGRLQSRRYLAAKIYAVSRRASIRARTRRSCPSPSTAARPSRWASSTCPARGAIRSRSSTT